jgi:hypothetical protein
MWRYMGTHRRGVINSISTTDATTADITQLPHRRYGQQTTFHGDTACYKGDDKRRGS